MRTILLSLAFSFCLSLSHSQALKKISIGNSGCSVYAYCDIKFQAEYSQDSSLVYSGECDNEKVAYGAICVKLLQPIVNIDVAEETLISYLDYLKSNFKIQKAAGYGKGHRLANDENTRGVLDYWEDSDKNKWKIKGWTNGKIIGILYAYSPNELPETKLNVFLDGFRFAAL